jgi:hypothetical protein
MPEFLKRNLEWTIKNNSDSSALFKLDTLKLAAVTSIENSRIKMDGSSCQFFTNCRIDTLNNEFGNEVTISGCVEFRSGVWEYDPKANTLKLLIINDSDYPILHYLIRDMDSEHVLLIKSKENGKEIK